MVLNFKLVTKLLCLTILFGSLILSLSISNVFAASKDVKKVEGLFYLDGAPVSIEIRDGKITEINRISSFKDSGSQKVYVAPGLIDIQINGYASIDFSSDDLTVQDMRKATEALWKAGVTTFFPTLITNSHKRLKENFAKMAAATKDAEIGLSIPGYHLEGPYISPVDGFRGAHLKKWVRPPAWDEFKQYNEAADNKILLVTVAPEVEGAFPFIRNCTDAGIKVALGHHNGTAETVKQAIDAGAVIATHLGNGCANMINRHNNPLWPQLADDRMCPSIIVDGHHLTPEEVQVFYKVKGPERTLVISDALDLAGMPPGEYVRHGRTLLLTPEVVKFPAENVLAGAATPISSMIGKIMNFTQCSLADAIHMTSRNQARMFELNDRGEIRPGKRADLILFTLENNKVVIKKTILNGKVVYSSDN